MQRTPNVRALTVGVGSPDRRRLQICAIMQHMSIPTVGGAEKRAPKTDVKPHLMRTQYAIIAAIYPRISRVMASMLRPATTSPAKLRNAILKVERPATA